MKYVEPEAEFVASTQHAPEVAERANVKLRSDTSYVALRAVADCGKETAGNWVVGVVVVLLFRGGFDAVDFARPAGGAW